MKNIAFIFGVLLCISCGNGRKNNEEGNNVMNTQQDSTRVANPEEAYTLNGDYEVLKIKDEDVSSQNMTMQFDYNGGLATIITVCYNIRSNFEQNDNNIVFKEPIRTKKDCNGKIEYEYFDEILPNIDSVKIDGSMFNLMSAQGDVLMSIRKK